MRVESSNVSRNRRPLLSRVYDVVEHTIKNGFVPPLRGAPRRLETSIIFPESP